MAELSANFFRNYFGGSWSGRITKNDEFLREIEFNWPEAFGEFSALGTEEGLIRPAGGGFFADTKNVAIAGWRNDVKRWTGSWFNEFGGFGEVQWTSRDIHEDINILYGFGHECKQETDKRTDFIIRCEMIDKDNFKYTVQSFRKGNIEIMAKRIRTAKELNELMKEQVKDIKGVPEDVKYT